MENNEKRVYVISGTFTKVNIHAHLWRMGIVVSEHTVPNIQGEKYFPPKR